MISPSAGKAYMFQLSDGSSELSLVLHFPVKRMLLSVVAHPLLLEARRRPHLDMNMLKVTQSGSEPKSDMLLTPKPTRPPETEHLTGKEDPGTQSPLPCGWCGGPQAHLACC